MFECDYRWKYTVVSTTEIDSHFSVWLRIYILNQWLDRLNKEPATTKGWIADTYNK